MSLITQELDEIAKIIDGGKLKEAIKRIEELRKKTDITQEEVIRSKLLLAWGYFWFAYFNWQIQYIPDETYAKKSLFILENAPVYNLLLKI